MARTITCTCGICKKCRNRAWMQRFREQNPELSRAQQRTYYELRKRTKPALHEKWSHYKSEWAKAHPGSKDLTKDWARNKLEWAVFKGTIEKQPCEICGSTKSEAHHHDYSKPLDVRWLCRQHHADEHRRLRESKCA